MRRPRAVPMLPASRVNTDTAVATAASNSSSPAVRAAVITSGGKREEAVDEAVRGDQLRVSNVKATVGHSR